jgi:hypothetical protein
MNTSSSFLVSTSASPVLVANLCLLIGACLACPRLGPTSGQVLAVLNYDLLDGGADSHRCYEFVDAAVALLGLSGDDEGLLSCTACACWGILDGSELLA